MLQIAPLDLDVGPAPPDPTHFAREVRVEVVAHEDYREYTATVTVQVCSASWLAAQAAGAGWTWGRRRLIVPVWEPARITEALAALLSTLSVHRWPAFLDALAQYAEPEDVPDDSDAPAG